MSLMGIPPDEMAEYARHAERMEEEHRDPKPEPHPDQDALLAESVVIVEHAPTWLAHILQGALGAGPLLGDTLDDPKKTYGEVAAVREALAKLHVTILDAYAEATRPPTMSTPTPDTAGGEDDG